MFTLKIKDFWKKPTFLLLVIVYFSQSHWCIQVIPNVLCSEAISEKCKGFIHWHLSMIFTVLLQKYCFFDRVKTLAKFDLPIAQKAQSIQNFDCLPLNQHLCQFICPFRKGLCLLFFVVVQGICEKKELSGKFCKAMFLRIDCVICYKPVRGLPDEAYLT